MDSGGGCYKALLPVSPVRMRRTSRSSVTKILPSPTFPVLALSAIVSTVRSTRSSVTGPFDEIVGHGDLYFGFGQEIDDVFGAPVKLRMASLPTKSLDLADGHSLDTNFAQSVADVVKAKRFDDRGHEFHS
jgi:hypothetical protein